ncbi:chemotaxis protein CheW [Brevundimonas sp.]|uniref:chemotaxis protein CheW n=1 Tax=Brevundimonas sp. TaxID=1871086 RepID=UPI003BAAA890
MTIRVENALVATDSSDGLVSIRVGGQTFGVPVLSVQDVISETPINRVPLAPLEVAGSLNLRGRIVTAVDMRRRLGMPPRAPSDRAMNVIVEHGGELYALVVDDVGDVLWLEPAEHEPSPVTLSPEWRAVCTGLYRLEGELLLVLNIAEVLTLSASAPLAA